VLIGSQRLRFFEMDPHRVPAHPAAVGADPVSLGKEQICGPVKLGLKDGSGDEIFFELSAESHSFCLRVKRQEKADGYFGDLYAVGATNNHLPALVMVTNLKFGEKPPARVEMDGDFIRFTPGDLDPGDGRSEETWFEQPWSWHAWKEMAWHKAWKPVAQRHVSQGEKARYDEIWAMVEKGQADSKIENLEADAHDADSSPHDSGP